MDRKYAVMLLIVCIVMMAFLLKVEMEKASLIREVKTIMKTDGNCCSLYRNPMMPYVCALNISRTNLSTSYQPSPLSPIVQSDLHTT